VKNGGPIEASPQGAPQPVDLEISAVKNGGPIEARSRLLALPFMGRISAVKNGGPIEALNTDGFDGYLAEDLRREERRPH